LYRVFLMVALRTLLLLRQALQPLVRHLCVVLVHSPYLQNPGSLALSLCLVGSLALLDFQMPCWFTLLP
jgi:hypothetical protein